MRQVIYTGKRYELFGQFKLAKIVRRARGCVVFSNISRCSTHNLKFNVIGK